jgi:hypothetical protein
MRHASLNVGFVDLSVGGGSIVGTAGLAAGVSNIGWHEQLAPIGFTTRFEQPRLVPPQGAC